ncbi:MAG: type III pantothenate kinase [Flavobacteriales bacterium]|jgi:type III pantothenate kinase
MQLAIDRGNTQTKLSLFNGSDLLHFTVIEDDELTIALPSYIRQHNPTHAIVSDVRSSEESAQLLSMVNIPAVQLHASMSLPIEIRYETPSTLGPDRIANAAGAIKRFGKGNLLVIDCGSCITYTTMAEGALLGGGIAPGIRMRFRALHDYTGALPHVHHEELNIPQLVGLNTQGSIESGVLLGVLSETERMIARYREQFPQLIVIITGGDASFFEKHLKSSIFAAPYLTHEGLHEILRHHSA